MGDEAPVTGVQLNGKLAMWVLAKRSDFANLNVAVLVGWCLLSRAGWRSNWQPRKMALLRTLLNSDLQLNCIKSVSSLIAR